MNNDIESLKVVKKLLFFGGSWMNFWLTYLDTLLMKIFNGVMSQLNVSVHFEIEY